MADEEYDIVVLGGGTGGYSTAFRARQLGLSAAVVERDRLGGVCLHRGCIPTKSLLQAANLLEAVRRAPVFGLEVTGDFDWGKVMARKREVVAGIYDGLQALAAVRGAKIVTGSGRLLVDDEVIVEGKDGRVSLGFDNLVLATGSRSRTIPGLGVSGPFMTSDEALTLRELPGSVVVIGGGYIGVEFASLWRSFGVDVTIIEMAERLMAQEDEDISSELTAALRARGIDIHLGAKLREVKAVDDGNGAAVEFDIGEGRQTLKVDKVLVAVGREAVTDAFDGAGIALEAGHVKTDERLQTSRPGVYAVGDLLASPQLAHVAFAEGIFVAEEIAGETPVPVDYRAVPHCVYTHPEVAAVGLRESEARSAGHDVVVTRESFGAVARARIAGEPEGSIKIVSERDGPVLGIHMIGPGVSELISEAMLLIGWEAEAADVAAFIHPHPTLSEALGEAALKAAGKPLHSA